MIILEDKKNCCGCGACVQVCPKHCVSLFEDDEGFLYPQTQVDICVNCHLCEQVCPVLETRKGTAPLHTYAVKNRNDDIRLKSSSGGVFTLLAEKVLQQSGIVFGARFDENWEVVHDYTDSVEGLSLFRGSKYVQSRMGNSYVKAKSFLKEGRMVLFSGTPCQIAGLKIFLKKEYANLLTVDFLCHGVPAPKVWRMYLAETRLRYAVDNRTQIREVNFRLKKTGWKNSSIGIDFYSGLYVSVFRKDLFMQAFLADLILRPSCYDCSFKRGKSGSDITIGDYWNVDAILPTFDDDKGVSLVLVNTEKGEIEKNTFLHYADCLETGLKPEAMCYNGGFKEKIEIPLNRKLFFSDLEHSIYVSPLMEKYCKQASGFFFRIKCLARKIRNKI